MNELIVDRVGLGLTGSIKSRATVRPVLAALMTALGFYLGAQIGFALTFHSHPVSTLWPPNSILLAALVLAPFRWWFSRFLFFTLASSLFRLMLFFLPTYWPLEKLGLKRLWL